MTRGDGAHLSPDQLRASVTPVEVTSRRFDVAELLAESLCSVARAASVFVLARCRVTVRKRESADAR